MKRVLCALSILACSATAHAATRFVDDSGSDVGDCTTSGTPCQTIQYAVDQAGDSDLIQIAAGTYNENVEIPDGVFTTALTFTGAGPDQTFVDGGSNGQVFRVDIPETPTITFNDLAIQHGTGNEGGGIGAYQVSLTLNNVLVQENQTTEQGAGVWLASDTAVVALTITDSIVQNNDAGDADDDPGEGGGIFIGNVQATINNSTIQGNTAHPYTADGIEPGEGGGIFADSSDLSLNNSTVDGNFSLGNDENQFGGIGGGGLYIECAGTIDIVQSTISNNVSEQEAGGIYVGNCEPSVLNITNSTISGNTAASFGGGIFTSSEDLINLTNTTITNNEADSDGDDNGDGGGIARLIFAAIAVPEKAVKFGASSTTGYVVVNTIIAGNLVNGSTNTNSPDCLVSNELITSFTSLGGNLIGTLGDNGNSGVGCDFTAQSSDQTGTNAALLDAQLGPLANNGGPTLTHLPAATSPAVDKALEASCPNVDQRGLPRPAFAGCDVGAVELQPSPSPSPTPTLSPIFNGQLEGTGCNLSLASGAANYGLAFMLALGLPLGIFWSRRK